MKFLLDTNVLSEWRKPAARRNPGLSTWWAGNQASDLFLSVLEPREIRKGIELVRNSDRAKSIALENWLAQVESTYAERILPAIQQIALRWGRAQSLRPFPVVDALVAATADEHGLQLVSRNSRDLQGWPGVYPVLDPYSP